MINERTYFSSLKFTVFEKKVHNLKLKRMKKHLKGGFFFFSRNFHDRFPIMCDRYLTTKYAKWAKILQSLICRFYWRIFSNYWICTRKHHFKAKNTTFSFFQYQFENTTNCVRKHHLTRGIDSLTKSTLWGKTSI